MERGERMERIGTTGNATWCHMVTLVCFLAPPLLLHSSDVASLLSSTKHLILSGNNGGRWSSWDDVLVKGGGSLS